MHTTDITTPSINEPPDDPKRQRRFAGVNDIMMRCAVTGFHFLWTGIGLTIVMFFILQGEPFPTDVIVSLVILSSILAGLWSFTTWRHHAISEKKERRFSMLAGAYWGCMLAFPYILIFPYKTSYNFYVLLFLPLIGICMGSLFPTYGCPTLHRKFICFWVLWLLTLFPFWLTSLICFGSVEIDYQAERLPSGLPTLFCHDDVHHFEDLFPNNDVTDIYVKGSRYGFHNHAHWRCRLPEEDFLAFAKKYDYVLGENDPYYNVNEETASQKISFKGKLPTLKGPLPTSYWIYNYHHRNGGGDTILYDRTTGILHGSYSTN